MPDWLARAAAFASEKTLSSVYAFLEYTFMKQYGQTILYSLVLLSLGLAGLVLLLVATQERSQDAALLRLTEENRIQDAHNVHTARAVMRAALSDLAAGRGEHARILAMSAMAAMIGLYHQPCGGPQTLTVAGIHVPAPLRDLFGAGDAYTIVGRTGQGAAEVLQVRVNAATTC